MFEGGKVAVVIHLLMSIEMQSGAVVKRADSLHMGCELESCTCHHKNTTGETGNGEPPPS